MSDQPSRRRGTLRVYLGAAPGVGKTYDMLNEGRRRRDRGTDVVVAFVETHGRARTADQIADLEVIDRHQLTYRGATFEEMDLDAVLARNPQIALVDELAHTNVPGSRNDKRWQDVEELLAVGIDVISTVNIQHLESINDVVERITGVRQQETVPDDVVRSADQVELTDMTPEALRRRLAHGNVYAAEKIDTALANYFREGNLTALRELALLWLADKVDVALERYRTEHGITTPWETRERVVVALTGAAGTEALIRRAARIAQRARGELLGVHVRSDEGLTGPSTTLLDQHRKLLEDMGGKFHQVTGSDIGAALVDFAHAENATQLVLGASQRSRSEEIVRGSVINRVVRLSGPIDVLVISHQPEAESSAPPRWRRWLRRLNQPVATRRRISGWLLALGGVPLLTLVLAQLRGEVDLSTVLLLFLTLTLATAAVGGTPPAVAAALGGFLAANWFFTPPFYRWTVAEGENVVALVMFVGVALTVSGLVDLAARRAVEAAHARSEATTLARMAATAGSLDPLPDLLENLRASLNQNAVAVLQQTDSAWTVEASAGQPVPHEPEVADTTQPLGDTSLLVMTGSITARDQLVVNSFAAQLAIVLEQRHLRAEAHRAQTLADTDALRSALLQAVSHDLRTPLAAIKVSASSLAQRDVHWTDDQINEFLTTINDETDRLTMLVGNLLDMSRVQAGALQPALRPVALEEVVPAAVLSLGDAASRVDVEVPETLPPVLADATLLERALVNIIENAVRFSPPDQNVRVEAAVLGEHIHIRVIDRGPGIPEHNRHRVFQPFQRLNDETEHGGVGLGLAVAKGFLTAIDAAIEIEDTPGGGTTTLITIPGASI